MLPSPISAREGETLVPRRHKILGDVFAMAMATPGWRSTGRASSKVRGKEAMVSLIFSYFYLNRFLTNAPSFDAAS